MRRAIVVAILAVGIIGVWWLAEDGGLQNRLGELGDEVVAKARGTPPPSWGDVADRVGEFATEEHGLKQIVGELGTGTEPSPDSPAAGPPKPAPAE